MGGFAGALTRLDAIVGPSGGIAPNPMQAAVESTGGGLWCVTPAGDAMKNAILKSVKRLSKKVSTHFPQFPLLPEIRAPQKCSARNKLQLWKAWNLERVIRINSPQLWNPEELGSGTLCVGSRGECKCVLFVVLFVFFFQRFLDFCCKSARMMQEF